MQNETTTNTSLFSCPPVVEESVGDDQKASTKAILARRRHKRRRRKYKLRHKKPAPPWLTQQTQTRTPKHKAKTKNIPLLETHNPVALYVQNRQEEAWNELLHDSLDPLFPLKEDDKTILKVLEGLYHMGVVRSVLLSACHVILDRDDAPEALPCLAQYIAHGVTRVPTPGALSQRLALLHVICTFRQQRTRRRRQSTDRPDQQTNDPVLLWQFLLGEEDQRDGLDVVDGEELLNVKHFEENRGIQEFQVWLSTQEDVALYVWIWELRGLVKHFLSEEEEERRLAHATADQLAHMVSMAAVTLELGLNQSTQALCHNMGEGRDWIKAKLGSPVKGAPHFYTDLDEDYDGPMEEALNGEDDRTSQVSSSSFSSTATSTASSVATTQSADSQGSVSKKTKQGIVHDAFTSYSRSARQATETARQTTQSYVAHFKQVSGEALRQTAASSRAWATQNIHSNTQHWAYLDASAKVALASLGAMGVLGEAVLHNTQTLLDHTTTVSADLVHHQFGPTAANVFEDVSRTATNVWRTTAQVAGMASPAIFAKAVVKQASKEQLRHQQEQEQAIRQQQ